MSTQPYEDRGYARSGKHNYDHISADDFDSDVWDALCKARLRYVMGVDKRSWYIVLREYAGYAGDNVMMGHMSRIVDAWLRAHPSWRGRYL